MKSFIIYRIPPVIAILLFVLQPSYAQVAPTGSIQPVATPIGIPNAYQAPVVNYVRVWEPNRPATDVADVTGTGRTTREVQQFTTYTDGLNRTFQTVLKSASTSGKDMVMPQVYDAYGREPVMYLPYIQTDGNTNDGRFKNNPFFSQKSFHKNALLYPSGVGEDIFYGQNFYEESPSSRVTKNFGPGNSWANEGGKNPSQQYAFVNTVADSVRIWNLSTGVPQTTKAYDPGQLGKSVSIDEDGKQLIEYYDKQGKLILKKSQVGSGTGAAHTGWLCTYFVYDELENLRFVIPPLAVDKVMPNWTVTSVLSGLCTIYRYDTRGRVIVIKLPGVDSTEMVYDIWDRPVLIRDANMKAAGNWLAIFYDGLSRPLMKALYRAPGSKRDSLQTAMSNATAASRNISYTTSGVTNLILPEYDGKTLYQATESITLLPGFESGSGSEITLEIKPTLTADTISIAASNPIPDIPLSALTPLSYTFYDNYNYAGKLNYIVGDVGKPQAGNNFYAETNPSSESKRVSGMVTGVSARILGTDQWLTTSIYYDDKGRVIQKSDNNVYGGKSTESYLYDYNGRLLSTFTRYSNPRSTVTPETKIMRNATYDSIGHITDVSVEVNEQTSSKRTVGNYAYDEMGSLRTKRIGVVNNTPVETQTIDYTISGALSGINKTFVNTANSSANWFGEDLSYDFGFSTKQYNGSISGAKWKSRGDGIARANGFTYDNSGRLLAADFTQQNQGTTAWANTKVDFTSNGINYDGNGNILSLKQKGLKGTVIATIDSLKYGYTDLTNKLLYVTDGANDPNSKLGDFKEVTPGTSPDYTYDLNGNIVKDSNRVISERSYNLLNLPDYINVPGKGNIKYLYTAAGEKIRKTVTDAAGKTVVTDYIGDLVYVNDSLQYFSHAEGRVRTLYAPGKAPAIVYDYFLSDHLGNTRSVLTEESGKGVYAATMETVNAANENALFANIDATRAAKPVGYPADATTSPNDYVAKLNATAGGQKVGPSLVLRVMSGDTVQIGSKAFYKSTAANTSSTTVANMLTALLQAFATGSGPSDGVHGNGTGAGSPIVSNFTSANYQTIRDKDPSQNLATMPKAYLAYVLFDDQMNMIDENSGVKQVQGSPDQLQTIATSLMVMKKTGFLYVYTTNESVQDVYFDNIVVNHTAGPLLEETHYYPFGLTMAGISSKALKNRYVQNNFNYNGIEQTDEFGLNQYDAYYRTLDPQIGRWNQIDPAAQKYPGINPYNSNFNNPVSIFDPLGDDPPIWGLFNGQYGWGYGAVNIASQKIPFITGQKVLEVGMRFQTNGFNEIGSYVAKQQANKTRNILLSSINGQTAGPINLPEVSISPNRSIEGFPASQRVNEPYSQTSQAFRDELGRQHKSFVFVTDYVEPVVTTVATMGLEGIFVSTMTRGSAQAVVVGAANRSTRSLVQANRDAGNLFRDELAAALRAEGRVVRTEVFKPTPFGRRFMDLEVWKDGIRLGGIEVKVGASRYKTLQRLKDWYLINVENYPVSLVRKPPNW